MSQKSRKVCVTIMLLKFASPFVKSQGSVASFFQKSASFYVFVIVVGQGGYASVKN